MAKQGISIREAARRLAEGGDTVTDTAIRKWIAKGLVKTLPDGSLDPEMLEAQAALARKKQSPIHGGARIKGQVGPLPEMPGGAGGAAGAAHPGRRITFAEARTASEEARSKLLALEVGERCKELVRRADVDRALTDLGALAASVLERIPARLAPVLAAETDAHKVWTLLSEAIDEAREEMAARALKIGKDMAENDPCPPKARSSSTSKKSPRATPPPRPWPGSKPASGATWTEPPSRKPWG